MEIRPHSTRNSPLHVFLSYRSVEARFADVLKQHLVEDFIGLVDIFLDTDITSIPFGTTWLDGIIDGLRQSSLHIVICSKYAVSRPWINYEIGATGVQRVPIVPLCHSGLTPAQLPVPLSLSVGGIITDPDVLHKLYARVADLIGSNVPTVDFKQYAAEYQLIEESLAGFLKAEDASSSGCGEDANAPDQQQIKNPSILCVTSEQFRELGYENQLQVVLEAFPENLRHQVVLKSDELQKILSKEPVDIIHIAAFVCPRGGDLYFSRVTLPLGARVDDDIDLIKVDSLVALLRKARTRLVVLGGSASLVLAAELLPVANVIAVRDMVSAKAMASWVKTFYQSLAGGETLAAACEFASDVSQAPMKLYAQQRQIPDMTVSGLQHQ